MSSLREKDRMATNENLVVAFTGNRIEADVMKSLLDNARIPNFLKDEFIGGLTPWAITPGGVGAVKVLITEKDIERARPIVEKFLARKAR